jgi:release factor glutamine methyltransferase
MEESSAKTVGEVIRSGTDYLARKNAYQPRQACELLASRLLKCKRLELVIKFDQPMAEKHMEAMRRGLKRLAAGEPAQYVVGQVEFMGHPFAVDRRALIPRPETETLVETVLACEPVWHSAQPLVVDLGTGSGCIAASLALARPGCRCLALDASKDALELAAENAAALGVLDSLRFGGPDLAEYAEPDTVDAVVTNLPYIPTAVCERLPVHIRDHEPRIALDGGADGLAIIRNAVPDAWIVLRPEGWLFLEIGDDQARRVASLLEENSFSNIKVRKDLAGRDRIVAGVKNAV